MKYARAATSMPSAVIRNREMKWGGGRASPGDGDGKQAKLNLLSWSQIMSCITDPSFFLSPSLLPISPIPHPPAARLHPPL